MENNSPHPIVGVILMTYGSATSADHVAEYMHHIYKGNPPAGLIEDFEERYRLVGHSPLIEITKRQAKLVESELNNSNGAHYIVRAGMLHSDPFIEDAIRDCKNAGAERCVGVVLSPQFSSFIMDGYVSALTRAAEKSGFKATEVTFAGPWPTEPHFIQLLGERIKEHKNVPVVFTTHSLPKRVVEKDPSYLEQLRATIDAVVKYIGDPHLEWYAGYQSAGHTPEEWLKPDLTDILADLKQRGIKEVLIAPIQFLADHLEILYDLDIAARKQCKDIGINYHRIQLPNTAPLFIASLCSTIRSL